MSNFTKDENIVPFYDFFAKVAKDNIQVISRKIMLKEKNKNNEKEASGRHTRRKAQKTGEINSQERHFVIYFY